MTSPSASGQHLLKFEKTAENAASTGLGRILGVWCGVWRFTTNWWASCFKCVSVITIERLSHILLTFLFKFGVTQLAIRHQTPTLTKPPYKLRNYESALLNSITMQSAAT